MSRFNQKRKKGCWLSPLWASRLITCGQNKICLLQCANAGCSRWIYYYRSAFTNSCIQYKLFDESHRCNFMIVCSGAELYFACFRHYQHLIHTSCFKRISDRGFVYSSGSFDCVFSDVESVICVSTHPPRNCVVLLLVACNVGRYRW